MKNKVGILIQARSSSSRLKDKIFLPLTLKDQTKTVLEWIYIRLQTTKISDIFFIIPENDSILISFCKNHQLPFLTGPLEDVRQRYIQSAKFLGLSHIVRVTADNPFVEPILVLPTIENLISMNLDLFSFIGLPLGVSIEAFSFISLIRKIEVFSDSIYKEHVSLHIKKHSDQFRVFHTEYVPFRKYYEMKLTQINNLEQKKWFRKHLPRLTLDQKEDYEVFLGIYKKLKWDFSIYDVMDLYFENPDLFKGNLHVRQRKF